MSKLLPSTALTSDDLDTPQARKLCRLYQSHLFMAEHSISALEVVLVSITIYAQGFLFFFEK